MTFAAPAHLLALLALPLVALAYAVARNRRRRYAVRFPATTVFARVAGGQSHLRRLVPPALLATAAAACAVALAKPERSVAVTVTSVGPTGKKLPDGGSLVTVGFSSQSSTADTSKSNSTLSCAHPAVASSGHSITGGVVSSTITGKSARNAEPCCASSAPSQPVKVGAR